MTIRLLDSHLHFWRIGGPGQVWPDAGWPRIYRDFLPADLHEEAAGLDLAGCVLVQSQPDDRDTDWMLTLDDPLIRAIVTWVDLADGAAPERIRHLASQPRVRGVRPMLQGIADTDWINRAELEPGISALVETGLRFDALVQPRHLPAIRHFATRWPTLPIVIDHAAKPGIAGGEMDPWRADLAALATLPNVWCKLSGLRIEQAPGQPVAELRPYVTHLLECFGTRLMWGSDWPVLRHAGDGYGEWVAATRDLIEPQTGDTLERLFAGAAGEFYNIDV